MRVQVLPADQGGCAYYRCKLPLKYLDGDFFLDDELTAIRDTRDGSVRDAVAHDPDVDVVVLQRPMRRNVVECIEFLQARGVAVVVEMDDDLTTVPRANRAWEALDPTTHPDENRDWALKACRIADHVTVSTPQLAEVYGKHGRVSVIRNYVDDEWVQFGITAKPDDRPWLGWTGNVSMHPHDLDEIGPMFRQVLEEAGAFGYIIGGPLSFPILNIDGTVADYCEWLLIDEYPHEIQLLDVGIVPLHDSKFNQSKSWLKGLEYAALGVPFVASPRPEYIELGKHVHVDYAKTPAKWRTKLTRLLTDEDYRVETAQFNRAEVDNALVMSKHAHEYVESWERALIHRRTKVATKTAWPSWVGKKRTSSGGPLVDTAAAARGSFSWT